MSRFPDVLRATTKQCNRMGKTLAVHVIVLGAVSIAAQLVLLQTFTKEALRQARNELPPAAFAQVEEQLAKQGDGANPESVLSTVLPPLQKKIDELPENEQEAYIANLAWASVRKTAPLLALAIGLVIFLWVYGRAAFFVLASRQTTLDLGETVLAALRALPGILAIDVLSVLLTAIWALLLLLLFAFMWPEGMPLALLGLVPAFIYLPRLWLAPAVYVHDQRGILESLGLSIAKTKGQWLRLVGNFLGVGAVVWIGTTLAQIAVNLLIRMAGPINPAAWWLGTLMAFVGVLASAYRVTFTVKLKEAVIDGK